MAIRSKIYWCGQRFVNWLIVTLHCWSQICFCTWWMHPVNRLTTHLFFCGTVLSWAGEGWWGVVYREWWNDGWRIDLNNSGQYIKETFSSSVLRSWILLSPKLQTIILINLFGCLFCISWIITEQFVFFQCTGIPALWVSLAFLPLNMMKEEVNNNYLNFCFTQLLEK